MTPQTDSPTCPGCGKVVEPDSRFCKHCAFDLTKPNESIDPTLKRLTTITKILLAVGFGILLIVIGCLAWYNLNQSNSVNTSSSEPNRQSSQSSPPAAANAGPPDDLIKSQVTNIVKHSLTNNNYGYTTTSVWVGLVEIVRRGEFHPNERFVLLQVRTKGQKEEKYNPAAYGGLSCDNKNTLCERTCMFDATNEFRIYRNDYGDWLSEIAVPWQFGLRESCGERLTE